MQRRNRLSRSRDFDAVYRHGRSTSTRFLVLYWFRREETAEPTRLGIAVPKKVGNAVVRNRYKRLFREAFRLTQHDLPAGVDLILIPRPGAEPALEVLKESLVKLARQAAKKLGQQANPVRKGGGEGKGEGPTA